LQIHAGLSPVTIAAWAGNRPKSIWDHYAREFERSDTAQSVPLAEALLAARREAGATSVRLWGRVVVPENWPEQEATQR
jgi:hypothetical protein